MIHFCIKGLDLVHYISCDRLFVSQSKAKIISGYVPCAYVLFSTSFKVLKVGVVSLMMYLV